MITNFRFGVLAEYFVMLLYQLQFYSILHHRMRNIAGEIDLICQRGKLLVFVEVKARSSNFDDILCTNAQQQRIRRAAEIFIQRNTKYSQYQIRFDLVIIRPYKFPKIIKNAW
jgi:putative endonuclease